MKNKMKDWKEILVREVGKILGGPYSCLLCWTNMTSLDSQHVGESPMCWIASLTYIDPKVWPASPVETLSSGLTEKPGGQITETELWPLHTLSQGRALHVLMSTLIHMWCTQNHMCVYVYWRGTYLSSYLSQDNKQDKIKQKWPNKFLYLRGQWSLNGSGSGHTSKGHCRPEHCELFTERPMEWLNWSNCRRDVTDKLTLNLTLKISLTPFKPLFIFSVSENGI